MNIQWFVKFYYNSQSNLQFFVENYKLLHTKAYLNIILPSVQR